MLLGGPAGAYAVNPLPVQPVKIHCPPRRDDTLSRERLNTWLDHAATGRLGLIVAEAGFGKTTLLADWARETGRMTAWYRLEPDDRDWLTFIRHLVATGRELDPGFAPKTYELLLSLGPGGPTPRDLTVSIAREMAELGTESPHGLTLIFDDYHVVDGSPETDPIVRALLDRTAPGFSVVIATRSMPAFSLGRLRARGGVMAIEGRDLCFDVDETSRLFRDAYRHPLDADVASELCDRTEGWAALLTLVRTSLEERSDPRALVSHLDASRGDLYEFLAEEVLATLTPELQHFLTRVSVLTAVDVTMAMLVDERSSDEIEGSIRESERLGLLSRPDRESPHRFHPLVREFLVARLTEEIGGAAVREVHRFIGTRLASVDWQSSAWHLLMAGDTKACEAVVDAAVDVIVAAGAFDEARPFLESEAGDRDRPVALILRSKIELGRGDFERAAALAQAAVDRAHGGPFDGVSLLNLASILGVGGFPDEAVRHAAAALERELSPAQRYVAEATVTVWEASEEGDLKEISDGLRRLAAQQEREGLVRYAGISRLNRSGILLWLSDAPGALREATRAETVLGGMASQSIERVAATSIRGVALAQLGRLAESAAVFAGASSMPSPLTRDEIAIEAARVGVDFGSIESAEVALRRIDPERLAAGYRGVYNVISGHLALRRGDAEEAMEMCGRLALDKCADAAGKLRGQLLRARAAAAIGSADAVDGAIEARRIAESQHTRPGQLLARLLHRHAMGEPIDEVIAQMTASDTWCLSLVAEEIVTCLDRLSRDSMDRVAAEARLRPDRWRSALRNVLSLGSQSSVAAAALLADIGSVDDAAFLRSRGASKKNLRPHALAITQRLAESVYVDDLGVVEILVGPNALPRGMRRKVLALLCFLSSRPGMAASRDEVLDALWPDVNPVTGSNSLHQAIYYLRRVFEPDFRESMSANYIKYDGDVVSLNSSLVDSGSRECWRLIHGTRRRAQSSDIDRLLAIYKGKYALDFAYEDWASSYRENLHAAILAVVEAELVRAREAHDFDRAIGLGHTMLSVDPQADGIELELLRAYKGSGRQAAAAEQYAHYAGFVRQEMAAEPLSFDEI